MSIAKEIDTLSEENRGYLDAAIALHGHLCGAMPVGFRMGLVALDALGEQREKNMRLRAFVETGEGHAAGCFADGVQFSTGCTFGKGLLKKLHYGKWAMILVDSRTGKAVRVSLKPEVIEKTFQSPFMNERRKGIPPADVDPQIAKPVFLTPFNKSVEDLFIVEKEYTFNVTIKPGVFNIHRCQVCGEVIAENYTRLKDGKPICLACLGK